MLSRRKFLKTSLTTGAAAIPLASVLDAAQLPVHDAAMPAPSIPAYPVSYTHLDVYKRQPQFRSGLMRATTRMPRFFAAAAHSPKKSRPLRNFPCL